MKLNLNERNTSVNLALTGLMAALVLVATMFFKVEIPVGTDKTMIGFANVFCKMCIRDRYRMPRSPRFCCASSRMKRYM